MKIHPHFLTSLNRRLFPAFCILLASASLLAQNPTREWINTEHPGRAIDVVTDSEQDVFVTQIGSGPEGNDAIQTIKYNPSGGGVEWSNQYNTSRLDHPVAMAIDASGNVYIVGNSFTNYSRVDADVVIIKYNFDGSSAPWVKHFNGEANLADEATSLAIDPTSQDVVVTVHSKISSVDSEIVILRYTTGGARSVLHHNGSPFSDYPAYLKIDLTGNVYVAATSYGVRYDSPSDRVLLKYGPTGIRFSPHYFNRGINTGGSPTHNLTAALEIDEHGAVYTMGYDDSHWTLLRYDPDGTQQELADNIRENSSYPYSYPNFALYNSSQMYITLNVSNSINIYEYASATGLSSPVTYTSSTAHPIALSNIKFDPAGNLYLGIERGDLSTLPYYLCLKYDPSRRFIWEIDSRSLSLDDNEFGPLHIDDWYNVYIAGSTALGYNAFIAKWVPPSIIPEIFRGRCAFFRNCLDPYIILRFTEFGKVISPAERLTDPYQVSFPQSFGKNYVIAEMEVDKVFQPVIALDGNLVSKD